MNARQIGDIVSQLPSGVLIDRFGAEVILFLHVFQTAPIVYFFSATALDGVQSFIDLIALLSPVVGGWIWDNLASYLFLTSALVNIIACISLAVWVWNAWKKRGRR